MNIDANAIYSQKKMHITFMIFPGKKQHNIVDVIYSRTRFRAWRQATSVN